MLNICRFSAFVIDRDLPPSMGEEEIRAVKRRIQEEAKADAEHRLAVITAGREIENDVENSAFMRGVASLLGRDQNALAGFRLTGGDRYFEEIALHLGGTPEETAKIRRKLGDKVGLAEHVITGGKEGGVPPPYVSQLLELIRRSRVDKAL